jgi:GNAT superfamily N-acetyltransferase
MGRVKWWKILRTCVCGNEGEGKMSEVLAGFGWLGGVLTIGRGNAGDYRVLARFHYARGKPASWVGVWVVRWRESEECRVKNEEWGTGGSEKCKVKNEELGRVVAVGVLSYPTLRCFARERCMERAREIGWLNENVRTISRVIVHPQFRGVGVAARLVRVMCEEAQVKYVEAIAAMGRVHPFFEKGGMRRVECGEKGYFVWGNPNDEIRMTNQIRMTKFE